MKINETVTKSFQFSCEDAQIVTTALLKQVGKKTIKTAIENRSYYIPMLSAYGKIVGAISVTGGLRFTYDEKSTICDVLRDAWKDEEFDQDFRHKALALLEGIFNA